MEGFDKKTFSWDEWKIEKKLGAGSYGSVYSATRTEFGMVYHSAIKHISIPMSEEELQSVYDEGYASDERSARIYYEKLLSDLLTEIRVMYRLRGHANIVGYEDHKIIEKKNMPGYDIYIRMELLHSLNEVMRTERMTTEDICRLGIDICRALEVLREEKIVHRDIKPANILRSDAGVYKLGDFGVARQMERTSTIMSKRGTYSYMAPEVYRGEPASYTSDIYSLGLVMHRLLNRNRAPFIDGRTEQVTFQQNEVALLRRMRGDTIPAPLDADDILSGILAVAYAYRPDERYADARVFRHALQDYIRTERKPVSEVIHEDHENPEEAATVRLAYDAPAVKGREQETANQQSSSEPQPELDDKQKSEQKRIEPDAHETSDVQQPSIAKKSKHTWKLPLRERNRIAANQKDTAQKSSKRIALVCFVCLTIALLCVLGGVMTSKLWNKEESAYDNAEPLDHAEEQLEGIPEGDIYVTTDRPVFFLGESISKDDFHVWVDTGDKQVEITDYDYFYNMPVAVGFMKVRFEANDSKYLKNVFVAGKQQLELGRFYRSITNERIGNENVISIDIESLIANKMWSTPSQALYVYNSLNQTWLPIERYELHGLYSFNLNDSILDKDAEGVYYLVFTYDHYSQIYQYQIEYTEDSGWQLKNWKPVPNSAFLKSGAEPNKQNYLTLSYNEIMDVEFMETFFMMDKLSESEGTYNYQSRLPADAYGALFYSVIGNPPEGYKVSLIPRDETTVSIYDLVKNMDDEEIRKILIDKGFVNYSFFKKPWKNEPEISADRTTALEDGSTVYEEIHIELYDSQIQSIDLEISIH